MLIKTRREIPASEITDERVYRERRRFLTALGAGASALAFPWSASRALVTPPGRQAPLAGIRETRYRIEDKLTPYDAVTTYNNFYEFGSKKSDPAKYAKEFRARPWKITVDGEVEKPADYDVDELIKLYALEERIYRLRCVEAWSMVIPWVGIPLRDVIKRFKPTARARFVEFTTLLDPKQMPGQRPGLFGSGLDWPYVEGLRMDEAMHPLVLLVVGLYGEVLPNQNGAPVRLVVPWKYGFKSIKSIVRMRFVPKQPRTSWAALSPNEYGFYANVNPTVDHPRWSQALERRVGEDGIFSPKRKTLMFNGYADEVGHLYAGMDLGKNY